MGDSWDQDAPPQRGSVVDVKEEPLPPAIKTTTRPPLVPPDRYASRKRSRSSEGARRGNDTTLSSPGAGRASASADYVRTNGGGSTGVPGFTTPSRLRENLAATPPLAMTPLPSPSQAREPVVYKDMMLSDSEWEREIAEFGRQLDDMLARVSDRQLVAQTAQYMRAYPQHSLRFQIKIKQRALTESPRQAQVKLMLFYLFHEFLKLFQGDELRQIQRDWYLTIDEVLHGCMRDMKNNPDLKKRIFKTVARWEELGIYLQKIKQWKALSSGEAKPRRSMIRLPRTEAERLAEAPDQLQQFPPPPVNQLQLQINRTNYPYVFERTNFRTAYDLKQHWRYSAIAFIEVLAQCLGISRDIALTASMFFHRVFDRGIYAKERFKFAAACIFLTAKAASKRMKLIRMVKTMHEILEMPLLAGDEEILDLERMQLLYYEIEVLKGVDFDLTTDMPFYYLKGTLKQMPEKFRQDVEEGAQSVLEELFWLPLCLTIRPRFLAEAAAYIACRNKDRIFSFSWCQEDKDGSVLTEKAAKEILRDYRLLVEWKKDQRRHFDCLVKTSSSAGGTGPWDLQEVFQAQRGGLRVDVTCIQHEMEYTQKGVNESRAVLSTYIEEDVSNGDERRRKDRDSSYNPSRRYSDDNVRIKDEPRSYSRDYQGSRDDNRRRDIDRSNTQDSERRDRGRDHDRSRDYRDRNEDRGRERYRDRESSRRDDRSRDEDHFRVKDEEVRIKDEPVYLKEEGGGSRDDRSTDRGRDQRRDRSLRRNGSDSRYRDSDRERGRDSGRDRDEARSRDRDRDRDRDHERERESRQRRRSRSRSPRDSSRSSKRKDRSSSRSSSRSRERSSHRSKSDDRGRDRKRSKSSSRDRHRDSSRYESRSDRRYYDRDYAKVKEEGRKS